MAGRVEDKTVIITGAGSGMGRAFAHRLAREGATVGVLDVRKDAAHSVCDELAAAGLTAMALTADVSERGEVTAAFDAFVEQTGRLDVLFNNAGFNKPMHLLDITEENWHSIMDVNALGTLIGVQEGARHMIPEKRGKIINTSSVAGRQGYPSFAPYCARPAAPEDVAGTALYLASSDSDYLTGQVIMIDGGMVLV